MYPVSSYVPRDVCGVEDGQTNAVLLVRNVQRFLQAENFRIADLTLSVRY